MGCCATIIKPNQDQLNILPLFKYPSRVTLQVKISPTSSTKAVSLILTKPVNTLIEAITFNSHNYWISSCILPGQDLDGEFYQKCLNKSVYLYDETSLFFALIDGHGPVGEAAASYCCNLASKFYRNQKKLLNVTKIQDSVEEFLKRLISETDEELRGAASRINADYSGVAAVFALVKDKILYSANVGDTRSILVSYVKRDPILNVPHRGTNSALVELKRKRNNILINELYWLSLTKDHKPETTEEANRIIESGGRVSQLRDTDGNRIGAYKVFDSDSNLPALTISRSIGDNIAKTLGVTSEPDITKVTLNLMQDAFVVMGSVGLWDAMDNDDIMIFIESFRSDACRIHLNPGASPELSNSCIARLLCEEARFRWLKIAEEDNVNIDDVSCIVLEIGQEARVRKTEQRRKEGKNTLKVLEEINQQKIMKEVLNKSSEMA